MPTTEPRPVLSTGLYLILTDPRDGYEALTRLALRARLPAIQLRYKGSDEKRFQTLAEKMRRLTAGSRTAFIVNDRPDIALAVNADGVHVGQEDLSPADVRRMVGDKMLVGLSTHNLEQVQKANSEPVDYIGFGPLFATTSKADPDPVLSPQMLPQAGRISERPIVAIGGLTSERIRALDLSACRNVAVISAVGKAEDPFNAMQTINTIVREYKKHAP